MFHQKFLNFMPATHDQEAVGFMPNVARLRKSFLKPIGEVKEVEKKMETWNWEEEVGDQAILKLSCHDWAVSMHLSRESNLLMIITLTASPFKGFFVEMCTS